MSDSVPPHRRQPTRLPGPWDSPGKNTGVGCHFLLQSVKVKSLSRVWLLATPWTATYQAPPSMGFSRQEVISTIWFQNTTPGRNFVPISGHSHSPFPPDMGIHSSVLCLCGCDGSGRFLEIGSARIWLFVPVFFHLVASLHGVSPYPLFSTP